MAALPRRVSLARRDFLALGAAATAAALLADRAFAAIPTGVKLHGLSAFGDLNIPKISGISITSIRTRPRAAR